MKKICTFICALTSVVFLSYCSGKPAIKKYTSKKGKTPPALLKLFQQLKTENSLVKKNTIISSFIQNKKRNRQLPIIFGDTVTFIYFNNNITFASVTGSFNDWKTKMDIFSRYENTNLYFLTLTIPGIQQKGLVYKYFYKGSGRRYKSIFDPYNLNISVINTYPSSYILPKNHSDGYLQLVSERLPSSVSRISPKRVTIYLPPSYFLKKDKKYPVLYMADGQNIWKSTIAPKDGWAVDVIANKMIHDKKIQEIIIVGIDHAGTKRGLEYAPSQKHRFRNKVYTGWNSFYAKYLIGDVKKIIDKKYRTLANRSHTAFAGASMGGVAAMNIVMNHPKIFGKAAVMSPPYHLEYIKNGKTIYLSDFYKQTYNQNRALIYLDSGTAGWKNDSVAYTRMMRKSLIKRGWRLGTSLIYYEGKGDTHGEPAWKKRFPKVLESFFPLK